MKILEETEYVTSGKAAYLVAVLFIIMMILFSGCRVDGEAPDMHTCNIEGCQYLVSHNAYGDVLTHKGNCSNPIHKCN